jgi:hypothetical protein
VPGGLSVKLAGVLVAFAFVGAFKLHTLGGDDSQASGATLSPSGASALASDAAVVKAPSGIAAPGLVRVAKLPALRRAPKPPAVHHAASHVAAAPVTHPVAPVVTPAPVVTAPKVTVRSAPKSSYVGKSFDSKG